MRKRALEFEEIAIKKSAANSIAPAATIDSMGDAA
jgi:hypothetical protein